MFLLDRPCQSPSSGSEDEERTERGNPRRSITYIYQFDKKEYLILLFRMLKLESSS